MTFIALPSRVDELNTQAHYLLFTDDYYLLLKTTAITIPKAKSTTHGIILVLLTPPIS
jgi:hypothetical protein